MTLKELITISPARNLQEFVKEILTKNSIDDILPEHEEALRSWANEKRRKSPTSKLAMEFIESVYAYKVNDLSCSFEDILEVFNNYPVIGYRDITRLDMQQYSTPFPLAWLCAQYVRRHEQPTDIYYEPTAGNGLLCVGLPHERTHVNELDELRFNMLLSCPNKYADVTNLDACNKNNHYICTNYNGLISNPPFGKIERFTGKKHIIYTDPQEPSLRLKVKYLDFYITLLSLEKMADNGRAAIIVGGCAYDWKSLYDDNGLYTHNTESAKGKFYNYLYSRYYVEEILNLDGDSYYAKQGTSFNVRVILINGRRKKLLSWEEVKKRTLVDLKDIPVISNGWDNLKNIFNSIITLSPNRKLYDTDYYRKIKLVRYNKKIQEIL